MEKKDTQKPKRKVEKKFPLRDMPEDIRRYVMQRQHETKINKGCAIYSMQSAIYAIIREHKTFKEPVAAIPALKN